MKKSLKTILALAASAFMLGACGEEPAPEPTPEPAPAWTSEQKKLISGDEGYLIYELPCFYKDLDVVEGSDDFPFLEINGPEIDDADVDKVMGDIESLFEKQHYKVREVTEDADYIFGLGEALMFYKRDVLRGGGESVLADACVVGLNGYNELTAFATITYSCFEEDGDGGYYTDLAGVDEYDGSLAEYNDDFLQYFIDSFGDWSTGFFSEAETQEEYDEEVAINKLNFQPLLDNINKSVADVVSIEEMQWVYPFTYGNAYFEGCAPVMGFFLGGVDSPFDMDAIDSLEADLITAGYVLDGEESDYATYQDAYYIDRTTQTFLAVNVYVKVVDKIAFVVEVSEEWPDLYGQGTSGCIVSMATMPAIAE